MAKIKEMPGTRIISGFRGILDFYYWKGIACCRSWPRKPKGRRSPAVMAGWAPFTYASREWGNLSPEVQRSYEILASDSALTGRDMMERAYLTGLYRNPIP